MDLYQDIREAVRKHETKFGRPTTVDSLIGDMDSVKPGGKVRIFTGEGDPAVYNHPEVIEAMARAAKPMEMLVHHYNRGAKTLREAGLLEEITLKDEKQRDAICDFLYCAHLINKLEIGKKTLRGVPKETREEFRRFLADASHYGAWGLMALGRYQDAIPLLRKSLTFNPNHEFARKNLLNCYSELGLKMPEGRH